MLPGRIPGVVLIDSRDHTLRQLRKHSLYSSLISVSTGYTEVNIVYMAPSIHGPELETLEDSAVQCSSLCGSPGTLDTSQVEK